MLCVCAHICVCCESVCTVGWIPQCFWFSEKRKLEKTSKTEREGGGSMPCIWVMMEEREGGRQKGVRVTGGRVRERKQPTITQRKRERVMGGRREDSEGGTGRLSNWAGGSVTTELLLLLEDGLAAEDNAPSLSRRTGTLLIPRGSRGGESSLLQQQWFFSPPYSWSSPSTSRLPLLAAYSSASGNRWASPPLFSTSFPEEGFQLLFWDCRRQ